MAFQSVPTALLFGIWSNKSDGNLEDSDCTDTVLLLVSMTQCFHEIFTEMKSNEIESFFRIKSKKIWKKTRPLTFQRSKNNSAVFSRDIFPQKFNSNEIESGVLEKSQEINKNK